MGLQTVCISASPVFPGLVKVHLSLAPQQLKRWLIIFIVKRGNVFEIL
jgi:hypothetical protein